MECCDPGAIREEELVAYSEGEYVRPKVAEHLARCKKCSAQLVAYQHLEQNLAHKLYRWDCPPNQVLGEYELGMLDDHLAAYVETHIQACVLCATEIASLSAFLADGVALAKPAASWSGVKQTVEQLQEEVLTGVRRIVAIFMPPVPTLAYQRSPEQQRMLWPRNYIAEDMTISLQLGYSHGHRNELQLLGLITCRGQALAALQNVPIQLTAESGVKSTEQVDELGNFVFSVVAPTTYTLEVQFPDRVIIIEQLTVRKE